MTKKSSTSFKENNNANPVGRPKGVVNQSTLIKRKIDEHAEVDSEEAYKELRVLMKEGSSTALQIYWDRLLGKKKRTVLIDKNQNRLLALESGLSEFEELTHDEIIKELSMLGSVNLAKKFEELSKLNSSISTDKIFEKLVEYFETEKDEQS